MFGRLGGSRGDGAGFGNKEVRRYVGDIACWNAQKMQLQQCRPTTPPDARRCSAEGGRLRPAKFSGMDIFCFMQIHIMSAPVVMGSRARCGEMGQSADGEGNLETVRRLWDLADLA